MSRCVSKNILKNEYFYFRYKNNVSEKIEECSYYDQNYSIFAINGYNWSINHLNKTNTIPCQYYGYDSIESVVAEVYKYVFNI